MPTHREVYIDGDRKQIELCKWIYACLKDKNLVWFEVPDFKLLENTNSSEITTKCVIKTDPNLATKLFKLGVDEHDAIYNTKPYCPDPPNVFYLLRRNIASYVYNPVNCCIALTEYAKSQTATHDSLFVQLYDKLQGSIQPKNSQISEVSAEQGAQEYDQYRSMVKTLCKMITNKMADFIYSQCPELAQLSHVDP